MTIKTTEYKGHTLIVLSKNETDKFPFQFGLSKAKLVLEHIEEIKAFVAEQEAKAPTK
jgi:hypothetical protein